MKTLNNLFEADTGNTIWHRTEKVSTTWLRVTRRCTGRASIFDNKYWSHLTPTPTPTDTPSHPLFPCQWNAYIELPLRDFPLGLLTFWACIGGLRRVCSISQLKVCHISAVECMCRIKCLVTPVFQGEFLCEITQAPQRAHTWNTFLKWMSLFWSALQERGSMMSISERSWLGLF